MAEIRTLGDVPGLFDLLPNGQVLPVDSSVLEVNGIGEVSAYDVGLGDVTLGLPSTVTGADPFALVPGGRDPQGGEGRGGSDPTVSSHAPVVTSDGTVVSDYGDGVAPLNLGGTSGYDQEQLDNAKVIVEVGKKVGATDRDIQTAIMAAIVESSLRNLDYGDRDSVGLFQQRDAWGSFEERTTPAIAAEMFFLGGRGGQQGLLDIADRDQRSLGDLAQDVQVSAYPDRYAEHEAEAASIIASLSGQKTKGTYGDDPYGLTEIDGHTVDNLTAAALEAATKEFAPGFRIMQGSHNPGGVAASGNTHDGGGVVDLEPTDGDWEGAVAALRKIGFAAWIRNVPGYGQAGEGAHIHAVLIGNEQLSPNAELQVQSYLNNDDGLSGSRPDDGPREWINNRFVWSDPGKDERWRETVAKDARNFLGTPFKWGGEDFTGVDNVGLIRGAYKSLGFDVPRTAFELAYGADPIPVGEAKPGDLIAWDRHPDTGIEHIGIYLGNNYYIDASAPGRVVQLNELGDAALNAWGIPMQDLIERRKRVAPVAGAPTYYTPPRSSTGQSLQGQASNPYTNQSPSKPRKPRNEGYGSGGTTFDQKPHSPMPGEY